MLEATPVLAALSQRNAIIASIIVVILVVIAWKFLKFAFKIGLVILAAVLIFLALKNAGIV